MGVKKQLLIETEKEYPFSFLSYKVLSIAFRLKGEQTILGQNFENSFSY